MTSRKKSFVVKSWAIEPIGLAKLDTEGIKSCNVPNKHWPGPTGKQASKQASKQADYRQSGLQQNNDASQPGKPACMRADKGAKQAHKRTSKQASEQENRLNAIRDAEKQLNRQTQQASMMWADKGAKFM